MGNELRSHTTADQAPNATPPADNSHDPETLVLVSRRYASLSPTWSQHGADLDTVLRAITDRARDGNADSNGYEIIEVTVRRRFHVQPVITAAEVTEVTA